MSSLQAWFRRAGVAPSRVEIVQSMLKDAGVEALFAETGAPLTLLPGRD